MKISIFGLGYVGAVSAACFAKDGHEVIGVDPNRVKVDLVNRGESPVVEKDLPELVAELVRQGRLKATTSGADAVKQTQLSLVCVGTPSQLNGSLDLSYVRRVCEELGSALRDKADYHVVVIRSTILPGTMRSVVIPILEEHSQKKAGQEFGVCNNPEFLREGTAIYDFYNPPKTVIGETDPRAGDMVASLYSALDAPCVRTAIETAEMVKYADNVWHALKVCFANEIGNVCKAASIDSHAVMDIFCKDTKLNLSPYYMKPGFAFGGSCLPKDVRALTYKARTLDLDLPVLNAILPSNERQIDRAFRLVTSKGKKRIGVLGFSFKAGTDDLRESPLVELIERLLGKGYDLRLYDRNVNLASLRGANRDFILNHIPHISKLMVSTLEDAIAFGEVIIVGNGDSEFRDLHTRVGRDKEIVELIRLAPIGEKSRENQEGICW
jgi:GDP-mannose 6-dehydrogenase